MGGGPGREGVRVLCSRPLRESWGVGEGREGWEEEGACSVCMEGWFRCVWGGTLVRWVGLGIVRMGWVGSRGGVWFGGIYRGGGRGREGGQG